ncbi:MAG: flagellar FliJ family protein [Rhodothermales bacterium]
MSAKPFKFSLDSVLKLRHHETEKARSALATATGHRREAEERLAEIQAEQANLTTSPFRSSIGQGARRFMQREAEQQRLAKAIHVAEANVDAARKAEQQARDKVRAQHQLEEALVRLRDQEAEAHQLQVLAAEAQFVDEQAITRYYRSQQL